MGSTPIQGNFFVKCYFIILSSELLYCVTCILQVCEKFSETHTLFMILSSLVLHIDSLQHTGKPLLILYPVSPGAPLTYFNDGKGWGGGGRFRVIFLGRKFWPKVIFLGLWKTPRFFWVAKKGPRDCFGYAKRSSDFFRYTNSEVVIFGGIKYEPLSNPPPPPTRHWNLWVGPLGLVLLVYLVSVYMGVYFSPLSSLRSFASLW